MRIRAASWIVALSIAVSAFAAPVSAQSPGRDPATGTKDSTNQPKDATKSLKDAGRALSQAFRDAQDKLRQTREDRRRDQRKELRDKWGPLLARPDVRDELRLHARRMARIDYIEKVSDDLDEDKIQKRAKRAMDMENERHDKRMAALKTAAGGTR